MPLIELNHQYSSTEIAQLLGILRKLLKKIIAKQVVTLRESYA